MYLSTQDCNHFGKKDFFVVSILKKRLKGHVCVHKFCLLEICSG